MSAGGGTHHLILDQGGHAGRASVFTPAGKLLAQASRPVSTARGDAGEVEQDAIEILDSLRDAVRQVLSDTGIPPTELVSAGLACQRSSVVCWHHVTGQALSPVLSWQDTRARATFDTLALDAESVWAVTGLPPSPHYGASKLAWCLRHLPAVGRALDAGVLAWGPLSCYLVHRLTQEHAYQVNHTIAQRTLLFDVQTRDWSTPLCDAFGIDATSLPECVPDDNGYGHLDIGGAGVPFQACAGDQNVVPFAYGDPDPDTTYINAGTGAFILRPLGAGDEVQPGMLRTLLEGRDGGTLFACEGTVNGAGAAFDWLARRHERDAIPWDDLECWSPAPGHPLFLNSIGDLGSPFWRTGVSPDFAPADAPFEACLYAVAESIAFLVRANHERMAPTRHIRLTGGLSRSGLLCRLLATTIGTPIERMADTDMTSRGVLALLVGAPTLPAGAPTRFNPVPEWRDVLEARYIRWRSMLL